MLWVDNLEESEDGLNRPFEVDVMAATLAAAADSYWDEWAAVEAPCLVVRGESGELSAADAESMVRAVPSAKLATLPGGHDVHVDEPGAWRARLTSFLLHLT